MEKRRNFESLALVIALITMFALYVIAIFTSPVVLYIAYALTISIVGFGVYLSIKRKWFTGAIALAVGICFLIPSSLLMFNFKKVESQTVVHACGAMEGHNYLNCEEGFAHYIEKGHRLIEVDFLYTSDGKIIASHLLEYYGGGYNLNNRPTYEEALGTKMLGKYHSLTFDKLLDYLELYPDLKIVFDSKEKETLPMVTQMLEIAAVRGIDLKTRFIIQVYSYENYVQLNELNFEEYWYTNYKSLYSPEQIKYYFEDKENISTYISSHTFYMIFKMMGFDTSKKVGLHSISSDSYKNFLTNRGVTFVYTY